MMVGQSAPMQEVFHFIAKAAPTNSTVLIQGESGTGKELVARELHQRSRRSNGPLVAVNCATLSESLLESELFGHEKGAFTGAVAEKKGKFELAHGGTLFLDEVGELSPGIQAKLLRALQERAVDRIGGTESIPVDIRLVAATNRDLDSAAALGEFRQDLYYRLKVLSVRTPPLRERREDIPALARHFVFKYSKEAGRLVRGICPDAETILKNYHWPGNVRELENAIECAVVMGSADIVLPQDLPPLPGQQVDAPRSWNYHEVMYAAKRQFFQNALAFVCGDYNELAALVGLHPKCVHRALRSLKLTHLLR